MERIVHIAKNHEEAKKWEVHQAIKMTPEQRQEVAYTLKKRVFGEDVPDVRSGYHGSKASMINNRE